MVARATQVGVVEGGAFDPDLEILLPGKPDRAVGFDRVARDLGERVGNVRLRQGSEARALIGHFVSRRVLPPPQRQFLFLTRVVLGLYEYFARAEARLPMRALVQSHVGSGFAGRSIVVPPYDA